MKALIIIPYFGTTPVWIDYFLKSCAANPDFNWLLYGNFDIRTRLPSNVMQLKVELTDFNKQASESLGVTVEIQNPYKICDFRPAFGKIFAAFLKDADFWGYSDLDLVYGNLSAFIGEKDLQLYDVITSRPDYISGHFTLYRNRNDLNDLYKKIFRVKEYLKDSKRLFALDEKSNLTGNRLDLSFSHSSPLLARIWRSILYKIYQTELVKYDITQVLKFEEKHNLKILRLDAVKSDKFFRKGNFHNWKIEWDNGNLTDMFSKKELMYFHFLESKHKSSFVVARPDEFNRFCITKAGISPPNHT